VSTAIESRLSPPTRKWNLAAPLTQSPNQFVPARSYSRMVLQPSLTIRGRIHADAVNDPGAKSSPRMTVALRR